jgi:thiamine-phosphate pyrophosphorylase
VNAAARIIDANLNRAREGLRVMEDLARFALDDQELCAGLKALRHDLKSAAEELGAAGVDRGLLLANRDTPGDVGTGVTAEGEHSRSALRDVALAAAGRVSEAMRSIEEAAKVLGSVEAAAEFEALRYRGYALEQKLGLALGPGRAIQWRVCVLLTEALCLHHSWEAVAEAAIEGGADCVQLREKSLDGGELLRRARRLVDLAGGSRRQVAVIINDRPDVALLSTADGVHLGQGDLPAIEVRRLAGDRLLIGISTANLDQARAAVRQGTDYCGVGPMFATSTKHKPELSGPGYLREYLADEIASRVPHLAIAGITAERARELRALGCLGIAASSAVCSAADPLQAVRELRQAME